MPTSQQRAIAIMNTSYPQDYLRMPIDFDFLYNTSMKTKRYPSIDPPVLPPIVLLSSITAASDLSQFRLGSVLGWFAVYFCSALF
jgi:hypothetical protein